MSQEHWPEQDTLFDLTVPESSTPASSTETTALSRGEFWTVSISEWPNEEDAYSHTSLSDQVLTQPQDESFYLTTEACLGILDRGCRNAMQLDPILSTALRRQAGL